jgi:BASS family bile acid:Na+ symporter
MEGPGAGGHGGGMASLLPLIIDVSLVLIVASAGLGSRWSDLPVALHHPGLLMRGIFAVNVVVPAAAIAILSPLPIASPIKVGIVVMAVSPLAPLVIGKMLKGRPDSPYRLGLYVALALASVLLVPATFALLSALLPQDRSLPVGALAAFTLKTVMLPLVGGLLVGSLAPRFAAPLARVAAMLGTIGVLIVVGLVLYAAGGRIFALAGNGVLVAIVAIVASGLAAGHALGGPHHEDRQALAFAAATRHPGIAALVAQRHQDDPQVMQAIVLFLLVGIAVCTAYQLLSRRLAPPRAAPALAPAQPWRK